MFDRDGQQKNSGLEGYKTLDIFADLQQVIDINDGFERLQANEKAYQNVLLGFYHQHKTTRLTMMEYVRTQDWQALARLAHTLKGSGANLGAKKLASCAAELEYRIKASCKCMDLSYLQQEIKSLDTAVDDIIMALSLWKEKVALKSGRLSKEISTKPLDQQALIQGVTQIKKILWIDYVQAINLIEELLLNTQAGAYKSRLETCFAILNQFDIEAAAEHLDALMLDLESSRAN
ncbi:HPt (histidine-containing phosphotransfer) domain-containing protein [Allopseudospirillum japonicum]|uniref:HPt (Histidine-containing phosphotransfer) domain-containing protein n=1 Tax=Allopseudospirillum japonicum TaxID=64971 RepID=A0A1H6QSC2_9GAMM|nr:Hpt domain-containing protein [Allopseudospirillum japonicum]SEI42380.1 HPt (histidine-containing phosphotransfer) domain-containing protein [Allopseudospirillum japonicum]